MSSRWCERRCMLKCSENRLGPFNILVKKIYFFIQPRFGRVNNTFGLMRTQLWDEMAFEVEVSLFNLNLYGKKRSRLQLL